MPRYGSRPADPALVAYADQKHHIRAKAIELGVPVADGEIVDAAARRRTAARRDYDALRAAVERHIRPTGQAIVRGAMGASGASTFVVGGRGEDADGLLRRLSRREDNHVYLVESLVTATVSPHVQLHVAADGGPVTCVGVTDQRWERPFVHGGNIHPSARAGTRTRCSIGRDGWPTGSRARGTPASSASISWSTPIRPPVRRAPCWPRCTRGPTAPPTRSPSCSGSTPSSATPAVRESVAFVSGTLELRPIAFAAFRRAADRFLYSPRTGCGMVPLPGEPARGGPLRCGGAGRLARRGASHVRRAPDLVPAGPLGPDRPRLTPSVEGP